MNNMPENIRKNLVSRVDFTGVSRVDGVSGKHPQQSHPGYAMRKSGPFARS